MAVNSAGYQIIADGGIPQTFVGKAIAAVSGGQFVYIGSQASAVSSGANSFATSDLWVNQSASGTNYPVGVAVHNQTSGNYVTVITKGMILSRADGAISAGQLVSAANGADAVTAVGSQSDPIPAVNRAVGRALSAAGSAQYCLVRLDI